MRNFTAQQIAAYNASALVVREAILFDLASGKHGFWTGAGSIVWNTITFKAGGQIFEIGRGADIIGPAAEERSIKLRENEHITPTMLSTILDEKPHGRRVTFYECVLDPATKLLIGDMIVTFSGYVRDVRLLVEDGRKVIEGVLQNRNIDNAKRGHAMSNDVHHRKAFPDDDFFMNAGVVATKPIFFGQKTTYPKSAPKPKK